MPGLTVTASLDARQLEAKYAAIVAEVNAGQKSMATAAEVSSAMQIRAIEEEIAASVIWAKAEGTALLMKERAVAMAKFSAVANKADAEAKLENAAATEVLNASSSKTTRLLRQLLTIGSELSRGQIPRAISTTARMLADLGIPLGALIPIGLAVGAAMYVVYKTFHGMAEEAEKLGRGLENLKGRIEAHIDTMRRAAEEARKFHDELEKIDRMGEKNALVKSTEDEIAVMRKKFELQQRMARVAGQTPQQAAKAQQEEAKAEARIYDLRAREAEAKADIEKEKAHSFESTEAQAEINKQKEDLRAVETDANAAKQNLIDAKAAVLKAKNKILPNAVDTLETIGGPVVTFADNLLRKKLGKDANTPWGDLDVSKAQKDSDIAEQQLKAKQAAVNAAEEARRKAVEAYRDAQAAALHLREQATRAGEVADAEAEVSTDVKKPAKERRMGNLTELQRIGAYVGPSVSLIDVNKGIARDVAAMRRHQERQSNGPGAQYTTRGFE